VREGVSLAKYGIRNRTLEKLLENLENVYKILPNSYT